MHLPSLETLQKRRTRKWTSYDQDVIPLFIAESDFPTAPAVKECIAAMAEDETFGYTPAASGMEQALVDFYSQRYGYKTSASNVVAVADVVKGLLLGITHFTRPDSAVVVPVPAYPPFNGLPDAAGREKIEVGSANGIDLGEVEEAFAAGAGSILLANPNNPFGYIFSREFLTELCELAARYDARVLVDEIHAPLVLNGTHVVAAGVSDTAAQVCYTVTSTSKAWNIAGLKCAQIIFSNDADRDTWRSLNPVFKDGVGTMGVFATEACYSHGVEHLEEQLDVLRSNLEYLKAALPEALPGVSFTVPQATYLLWLDLSETALGGEAKPAQWLLNNARVALIEGTNFGTGGDKHVRLNFATSPEILREAVERIGAAVKKL